VGGVAGSGSPDDHRRVERRLATQALDIYESSSIGGFLYLVAWLPVAQITGLMARFPAHCVGIALVFLLLAIIRVQARPPPAGEAQRRWLNRYFAVVLVSVMIWATIQVYVVFDEAIPPLATSVSLFGTVAFCTVLAHLYASCLRLSIAGILILIVPTAVALWMVPELHLLGIAMTFIGGYLGSAVLQSRRDYHRRLDLAEALLEQRDRYELLSWTDELTGLCNRRRFSETLNEEVRQVVSSAKPAVILVLMDIDHFKLINDRFGHIIGDEALRRFARKLREAFTEPGMLVARTGGEEFALIASGTNEDSLLARADAFRKAMAAEPLQIAGLQVPMTASIGMGAFDAELHRNDDGFYSAVDVALYAAKQQGRNRVISVRMLDPVGRVTPSHLQTQLTKAPDPLESA